MHSSTAKIWICEEPICEFSGYYSDDIERGGVNRIIPAMRKGDGVRCYECAREMKPTKIAFIHYGIAQILKPYRWLIALALCSLFSLFFVGTNPYLAGAKEFLFLLGSSLLIYAQSASRALAIIHKEDENELPERVDNLYWVWRHLQGVIGLFFLVLVFLVGMFF
jgi:hypothetical protein